MTNTSQSETAKPLDPEVTKRLLTISTYISVLASLTLLFSKIIAWWVTDSLAMVSALADGFLDVTVSIVTLLAIRQSLQPANNEYRFGFGKIQALSSLGEAILLTGIAVFLLIKSYRGIIHPKPFYVDHATVYIMILVICINIGLYFFKRYVYNKTKSIAIRSSYLDTQADTFTNTGVVVTLLICYYFHFWILDGLFAFSIAIYILSGVYGIFKETLSQLLDKEIEDGVRSDIRSIILGTEGVLHIHAFKTRASGDKYFIQVDATVNGDLILREAHKIAIDITYSIMGKYPTANVMVHLDPTGIEEEVVHFDKKKHTHNRVLLSHDGEIHVAQVK